MKRTIGIVVVVGLCLLVIGLAVRMKNQRLVYYGSGMDPTIKSGSFIKMDRTAYNSASPRRGDIVSVQQSQMLILRVVGTPGERIEVRGGVTYINGKRLVEPYAKPGGRDVFPTKLSSDEYFLLGDNRGKANDSGNYGPVKKNSIIGKVKL